MASRREQSREIRVFISSTFIDLFREREHLVKIIFPEIRHLCRERGIIFTEVDLRWGLTHEDSSFGRVISTCLSEIDRCRPFFVGLIGDRYGWIPDFRDIHKNAYLMEEHLWLEEAVLDGSSLVEMEFNHAVLNSTEPMEGAYFYIREQSQEAMPAGEAPYYPLEENQGISLDLAHQKLARLKERVRESGRPTTNFSSVEALGKQVRKDLLATIEQLWPEEADFSALALERRQHESFAMSRRQAYIARQDMIRPMTDHALAGTQPLIVRGSPGLGKSALLAYWSRFFAQRHPGIRVVTHFIGSVSTDTGHEGLLRRILSEVRDLIGSDEPLPNTTAELEKELVTWLSRVPDGKLVLVIDALNQLEPRAAELAWLPEYLPPNVRIILSTTPGKTLDALQSRGWPELEVKPLELEEREALIARFLSEYRKSLTLEQSRKVASTPQAANPLFLRTFLEEMRLFGTHEKLDARIEHYLAAQDIAELFQRVLERIEGDFGAGTVREIMRLIWASRQGLTEHEILELTDLSRADLSQLLIALEFHLVQRHGFINFFHDYLRQAVERYYLSTEDERVEAHRRLIRYFSVQRTSPRKAYELPWHLQLAHEFEGLRDWLTDIEAFLDCCTEETQWDYLGYWLTLNGMYDYGASYRVGLDQYRGRFGSSVQYANALERVGKFLMVCAAYNEAESFFEEALPILESKFGAHSPEVGNALNSLGTLLQTKGEYAAAEPLLQQALSIHDKTSQPENEELAASLDSLATLLYYQGKFVEAEKLIRRAFTINERLLGPSKSQTIESLENLGVMLYSLNRFEEAETVFLDAITRAKNTLGEESPKFASLLSNLGAVNRGRGDWEAAVKNFEAALAINERLLGPDHPDTANTIQSLGVVLKAMGDLEAAEPLYRRAVKISEKTRGVSHPMTARCRLMLARLLTLRGESEISMELLQDALQVFKKTIGEEHQLTIACQVSIAWVLRSQGNLTGAAEIYKKYFPLLDQSYLSPKEFKREESLYQSIVDEGTLNQ
ncbi:MAG: tetratricopeptide repeat protein [Candidatus Kapaibacterium sp.]|jgi:nephrocystin-3